MACVAAYEGTPHFFLSQHFRRSLRASRLSVVRDYGTWASPVLDTRATAFELPREDPKPMPFMEAFGEDLPGYSGGYPGVVTDFVAAREGLVYWVDAFSKELIGVRDDPTPLRAHFGPAKPEAPSWGDGLHWEVRGEPAAAASLPGTEGWRIFPTREGYRRLRQGEHVVVRPLRLGDDSPWERLNVRPVPEEMRP